jgi:hypothetical protein
MQLLFLVYQNTRHLHQVFFCILYITPSGTPLVFLLEYCTISLPSFDPNLQFYKTCRFQLMHAMQGPGILLEFVIIIIIKTKCTSCGRVIRCAIVVKNSSLIPGVFSLSHLTSHSLWTKQIMHKKTVSRTIPFHPCFQQHCR